MHRIMPLLLAVLAAAAPARAQSAPQGALVGATLVDAPVSMQPVVLRPVALKARFSSAPQVLDIVPQDTLQRRRSTALSEWYGRRLTIHRYGSYVMVPLFIAQYALGTKLLDQKTDLFEGRRTTPVDDGLRDTHRAVAIGVGTLFVVNTTTGLWNLIETRAVPEGRARRNVHAITMLAADAGFAYTGVLGSRATDRGLPEARTHRNVALTSFGLATAGAAWMWFAREE